MVENVDAQQLSKRYFEPSSIAASVPHFALIVGGVGAGKTTLRSQKYGEGYVVVDGGEIFRDIADGDVKDVSIYLPTIDVIRRAVAVRAVRERRNIVMEIVGDDQETIQAIGSAVARAGYTAGLEAVTCDVDEALRRVELAVKTDPGYLSSYFTEDMHRDWIVEATAITS